MWSLKIISITEKLTRADGSQTELHIGAKFDGSDYPVKGSPTFDTIAFRRTDSNNIVGVGKRRGATCLRETVTADADGSTLALTYKIYMDAEVVAGGLAVFERSERA